MTARLDGEHPADKRRLNAFQKWMVDQNVKRDDAWLPREKVAHLRAQGYNAVADEVALELGCAPGEMDGIL